ncbi:hypothetical protein DAEQUDRAFT_742977 [Daedalea quercina L-15889]|uniref:Queuosine 5'-phosphate N-glycosylase/hydrolase n=1 Tax=Daedalea quercina L-15889 TaxID=1314783 RepID=A0A165TTX5_9APHY|nr:hypothetical protein DAEQUDRAFT_742977 [Daedalea quercina L-15889]
MAIELIETTPNARQSTGNARDAAHGTGKSRKDETRSESSSPNPVLQSAIHALKKTDTVRLNEQGIHAAAQFIYTRLQTEAYTPRTWRTHPLHLLPREPYSPGDPSTRACLDWIFVISSLNFSFWSEREGHPDRYGVEWRTGWGCEERKVHTGYWALVAAIDRAIEEGIPITDPEFYSSSTDCPDELIKHVFRPAAQCSETIPLLGERIAILRENGRILCEHFGGSFQGFCDAFLRRYSGRGTALQLAHMVVDAFSSFRDETILDGRKLCFWKRAQILVAETWAAFFPPDASSHPLFPGDAAISELTMFADYRVPQILHHLRILDYPPVLVKKLRNHEPFPPSCKEEISIRAASIVAVERVRQDILRLKEQPRLRGGKNEDEVSSVLIDFYLWDLAKKIEDGEDAVNEIDTNEPLPIHRTRGIWY